MPTRMQYGHFDDAAREYVITRPDTPQSWINYLGSRLYGGIITQNAGGYSFYKSGGTGRLMRMRFNGVPVDAPGRYVYIRDDAGIPLASSGDILDVVGGEAGSGSGDYWSASWQPVGKPLDEQRCTVRHGLGYSIFNSSYRGIETELTCFIPEGQAFEYWALKVTNSSSVQRTLSLFSYAEIANEWHYRQDLENLQYSQYIVQATVEGTLGSTDPATAPMIRRRNNGRGEPDNDVFFGLAGAEVVGFDTDRTAFLGDYRTPANPLVVEQGSCTNSQAMGDNACTTLQARISLAPGESRDVVFVLGVGAPEESRDGLPTGREVLAQWATPERVQQELEKIRGVWAAHLAPLQVQTPDPELNSMVNVWHAYQTHMTFNWSRGVSLVEAGDRDGLGYRDTVQDMLAVTHAIPGPVTERLDMILTGQTAEGGAMPLVKPLTHTPGKEKPPTLEQFRSDDTLWLPITVSNFVFETGDLGYLDKVLPYADSGEATVFDHLVQALRFSTAHTGVHGLVQGLQADWNDGINLGTAGESLFSTFLFVHGCRLVADLARLLGREEDAAWADAQRETIMAAAQAVAWDGAWFVRGISEAGTKLGSKELDEGSIYLESNVWAVISGAATPEQGVQAMDSVHELLASEHGVALCEPPHTKPVPGLGLSLLVYPPSHKENGGIFCHSNSWTIVAEALLGRGDRAYEYYRSYLPAKYNDAAEIHQAEPYVYTQFVYGKHAPRFGQARNPWLTGTASWTYVAVTQYLLGIKPVLDGLRIDPAIPAQWDGYSVRRRFRDTWVTIEVTNPEHVGGGVASMTIDGEPLPGDVVPASALKPAGPDTTDVNVVRVVLGARKEA
ncbi:MAG: hypothetical protein U0Q15_01010 [Kineosporiaceae bacterium]